MAFYHYKLEVIPRSFVENPSRLTISMSEIQQGLNPWLNNSPPPDDFFTHLRALLPINKSWSDVEEYVSAQNYGSDLRIWYNEDSLENIEFRYSPSIDAWVLMQKFINIVKQQDYLVVEVKSGLVFPPDEEILKQRLYSEMSHVVST